NRDPEFLELSDGSMEHNSVTCLYHAPRADRPSWLYGHCRECKSDEPERNRSRTFSTYFSRMVCRIKLRGHRYWCSRARRHHVYRSSQFVYPKSLETLSPARNQPDRGGRDSKNRLAAGQIRGPDVHYFCTDAVRNRSSTFGRYLDPANFPGRCAWSLSDAAPRSAPLPWLDDRDGGGNRALHFGRFEAGNFNPFIWRNLRNLRG